MKKLKILFICGSLRTESFNSKLAQATAQIIGQNCDFVFLPNSEFEMPLINQDIEKENTHLVDKLAEKILSVDAVIVASPEYNGSISSPLKNFIDWTSRSKKSVWTSKPVLLLAASLGGLGGIRGLAQTRIPFEALGAHVYSEMFGLAKAHEAFTDKNEFVDPKNKERLQVLTSHFLTFVSQLSAKGEI